MCDKCRDFSSRMNGNGKKPRKGTVPKCERIKLFKKDSNKRNEGRLKLLKDEFNEIIKSKGGACEKNMNLLLSRNYARRIPSMVRLAVFCLVPPRYSPAAYSATRLPLSSRNKKVTANPTKRKLPTQPKPHSRPKKTQRVSRELHNPPLLREHLKETKPEHLKETQPTLKGTPQMFNDRHKERKRIHSRIQAYTPV